MMRKLSKSKALIFILLDKYLFGENSFSSKWLSMLLQWDICEEEVILRYKKRYARILKEDLSKIYHVWIN